MMKRNIGVLLVLSLIAAGSLSAQVGPGHPGYYPIEDMGILDVGDLEVDVDLQGAMLQVAAGAMQQANGNADLAELVSGLDRVRVQTGAAKQADQAAIAVSFAVAIDAMKGSGWGQILKVDDDEEEVYLFAKEDAGNIVGLTAMVNTGDEEIVLINVVGTINPVTLGRVLASLEEMPDFDMFMGSDD